MITHRGAVEYARVRREAERIARLPVGNDPTLAVRCSLKIDRRTGCRTSRFYSPGITDAVIELTDRDQRKLIALDEQRGPGVGIPWSLRCGDGSGAVA